MASASSPVSEDVPMAEARATDGAAAGPGASNAEGAGAASAQEIKAEACAETASGGLAPPDAGAEDVSMADASTAAAAPEEAQVQEGAAEPAKEEEPKAPHPSTRAVALKLSDGDPILRRHLQHAMLAHLFGDVRRCFTNPRPGVRVDPGSGDKRIPPESIYAPVYPEGMAEGAPRRSDETPEERAAWEQRLARVKKARARAARRAAKAKAKEEAELMAKAEKDAAAAAAAAAEGEVKQDAEAKTEPQDDAAATEIKPKAEPEEVPKPMQVDQDETESEGEEDEEPLPENGADKLTFKELFVESLLTSTKCTRSVRANILSDPLYAEALSMVCFQLNVGRLNTTLAFYPEMKTMLRSYHAIPSIQTTEVTRKSLQDSPRLKSLLKTQHLPSEKPHVTVGGPPPSAATIAALKAADAAGLQPAPADFDELVGERFVEQGRRPPTSIVNLIFMICNHTAEVEALHLNPPPDGWALSFPDANAPVPSRQRARVFLWLFWHYLEGGAALPPPEEPNPFADEQAAQSAAVVREVWGLLSEEEQKRMRDYKTGGGRWKGLPRPLRQNMFRDAAAFERAKALAEEQGCSDADQDAPAPSADAASADGSSGSAKLLFRLLAPRMDVVAPEDVADENVDTAAELEYGLAMQKQRTDFVTKIVEETNAANAAVAAGDGEEGSPAPSDARASPAPGKKRGMNGNGPAAASLKKRIKAHAAAAAAAEKEAAGTAGPSEAPIKTTSIKVKLSKKGAAAAKVNDEDEMPAADPAVNDAHSEVTEEHPPPDNVFLRLAKAPLISPSLARPGSDSMARQAWKRILERAGQGIGDASYDSDQEDQADYEARDERIRPKLELARMLHCIRNSRTVAAVIEPENQR